MSGIEVAGLCLGIIPLIIAATERYREGSNFVARAIKKELLTARYRDELISQRVLLKLYVKGVVGKTDLPQDVQMGIAEDPGGSAWKDPTIIKAIVDELGDAHEPFVSLLVRISTILVRFLRAESMSNGNTVDQLHKLYADSVTYMNNESSRLGILERLKFSWRSSEWKVMIEELQSCNTMLERLSLAAERAKPFIKRQRSKNVHAVFEHRECAEKLFYILRKSCSCQPAGLREVGIRLQAGRRPETQDGTQGSTFRILIVDAEHTPYEISAHVEMVPKYSNSPPPNSTTTPIASTQVKSEMKPLEDICAETRAAHASRAYLHLFADHSQQLVQRKFSTLSDVLKACQAYNTKRWLHKEKSILAINLAYSLIQLHDGPWYNRWTSSNIIFIKDQEMSKTGENSTHISLRSPYTRLALQPSSQPTSDNTEKISKRKPRRNVHLHTLGIILMELHLDCPIEELAEEEGTDDLRGLAQELLEEHADDLSMSSEYLQAVRFCLSPRPNPKNGSFDFKDAGFREMYYAEVIGMLEENLMQRFDAVENSWDL